MEKYIGLIEVIAKVIQKKSKMQLQRVVKGNLRLLPGAATVENTPFANQSRCAFGFLRTFESASSVKIHYCFYNVAQFFAFCKA